MKIIINIIVVLTWGICWTYICKTQLADLSFQEAGMATALSLLVVTALLTIVDEFRPKKPKLRGAIRIE